MHRTVIVASEQDKTSWLHAMLRRERKRGGSARVVVFVKTEEAAIALHGKLRKSFPSAVNAGQHAADGLARFREGDRLVLVTPDGRVPAAAIFAGGAVGVSWDPPSGLPAHRSRMRATAGAVTPISHQLLVLRHQTTFSPPLDPGYARVLLCAMKLSSQVVPLALSVAAELAASPPVKRQKAAGQRAKSHVFYHGTSTANAQLILAHGFKPSLNGCLGPGVYVAHGDKATRFACNCAWHGGTEGTTLTVRVTFTNAKYVEYDDKRWQAEGYDACRAAETCVHACSHESPFLRPALTPSPSCAGRSGSSNMEWCLKSPEQCEVLDVDCVQCKACDP